MCGRTVAKILFLVLFGNTIALRLSQSSEQDDAKRISEVPSLLQVKTWMKKVPSAKYRGIQLYHLPKAGGNWVSYIMNRLFSDRYQGPWIFDPTKPEETISKDIPGDTAMYKIALIRNPCNYYLSVWHMQASGHNMKKDGQESFANHGDFPMNCVDIDMWKQLYNVSEKDTLTNFINYVNPKFQSSVGMLGQRMVGLLATGQSWKDYATNKEKSCPNYMSESDTSLIANALDNVDLHDMNCWLDTERLSEDLFTCLRRLAESEHPQPIFNETTLEYLEAESKDVERSRRHMHAKAENTLTCTEAFDENLGQLVMKREESFARKFGYNQCCEPLDSSKFSE